MRQRVKMANKSDDYEAFIASILAGIKKSEREIERMCCGRKNKLKGESGQSHQVDISFIDRTFEEPTLVLIECKRCTRKVSVDVAKILKYNATDISLNPDYPNQILMIIVSISDFQDGTRRVADYEQIRLHTVGHGPPFGFDYENIIFVGQVDQFAVNEYTNIVISPPSDGQ
jgi:hypothetical protein